MARKSKAEAEATRDGILDAAESEFCSRGVARSTLQDIAAKAGLTRGAVYWHFKGKYDLLLALWERAVLPIDEAFDEIDAADLSPLERIRQKSADLFGRIVHDRHTRNLLTILLLRCEMVEEVADARQHILACRDECHAKMGAEFERAVEQGELAAATDPAAAAITLHALIDGLAYHWLLAPDRFDLETVGTAAVDGWLCGLGGGAPVAATAKPPA